MSFTHFNEYVLEDILKYVPVIDRIRLELVSKPFKLVTESLNWKLSSLQFMQAFPFQWDDGYCGICSNRKHFVSHECLISLRPVELKAKVLEQILCRCPNLKTIVFYIISGFSKYDQLIYTITRTCRKLEHLELWVSPDHIPVEKGIRLTGLNLSCLRIGLMLPEVKPQSVTMFRHMLTKCPKLQEIYSEDSITAKFSKKLDWLIGYEDDIMSQLIVDGFRMEYLDLMAADAYAVTEDVLKYITRKVSKLKYLKFHTKLDFEEIGESLKLDQLESLHIVSEFRGLLKRSSVIKIHQQCPKLKHLKLDQHWGAWQQLFVWKGYNNL